MGFRACRVIVPAVALVVTVVGGVNVASATSFTYDSYTVANEQNIQINTPNNIYGGAGQVTLIGSGADNGINIPVWCLDIYTYLLGSDTYQVGSLTTAGAGGSPSNPTLTTTQIGEIGALIVNGNLLIGTSPDVSAATQLAIWEVEYPNFTYSGLDFGAISLAAGYLTELGNGSLAPVSHVSLLTDGPNNQSMGFVPPATGGFGAVTPLPSTWTMLLAGLAGLGFFASRQRSKDTAAIAAV